MSGTTGADEADEAGRGGSSVASEEASHLTRVAWSDTTFEVCVVFVLARGVEWCSSLVLCGFNSGVCVSYSTATVCVSICFLFFLFLFFYIPICTSTCKASKHSHPLCVSI